MNTITLPDWALNGMIGADVDVKVEEIAFRSLGMNDADINKHEFGKSHNIFEGDLILHFTKYDPENYSGGNQIVVIDRDNAWVSVYKTLDDAVGYLIEAAEGYIEDEDKTDDALGDAFRHCVDYRMLSKGDCETLLSRLESENEEE